MRKIFLNELNNVKFALRKRAKFASDLNFRDAIKKIWATTVIRQAAFALLIMGLSRLAWALINREIFTEANFLEIIYAFGWGLYFDLPVLAYFFIPLWIWMFVFPVLAQRKQSITKGLFTLSTLPLLLLNGIDTAYSMVSGRRSGPELFDFIKDPGNSNALGSYILDFWWAFLLIAGTLYIVYRLTPSNGLPLIVYSRHKKTRTGLALLGTICFWSMAARGGFHLKPLSSLHAGLYVSPELTLLTVSTPLNIISMPGGENVPSLNIMQLDAAEKIVKPIYKASGNTKVQPYNIVLIIVESLGRDYTGFLNNKPYTPFLDTFSKRCLNFRYCYANGTRSIEMVPSIFCGMPGLIESHYLNSGYANNKINNAFEVFHESGYSTGFYHGATNGTMFFQGFLQQTGHVDYFGLNEYPKKWRDRDYDGNWGIYDEPYLSYFLSGCDTLKKPFFNAVFTLSSHHPYHVPKHLDNQFPKGKLPIHKSIRYTDYALKQFFAAVQKHAWFNNTIFVITGDHTSYGEEDYFYSPSGHFEIPLLFYGKPIKPGVVDKTVSQCDIVPTLMAMTGVKKPMFGFGKDMLDSNYSGYSMHKERGLYYIIKYPYALGINTNGEVKDYHLQYRNRKKPLMLKKSGPTFDSLSTLLKAHIQVFTHRVRNNLWYSKQP